MNLALNESVKMSMAGKAVQEEGDFQLNYQVIYMGNVVLIYLVSHVLFSFIFFFLLEVL